MTTPPDPGLDAIMSERRQLINLAYRLLGSLAEAEDAVQETYARWYALTRPQQDAIENPGGWLTTVASRICLNLLGSARARRETYVGDWIPEPLPGPATWIAGRPGGTVVDPADRVTLDESVNMAFLVILESMTPAERVAFILHDVFGYSFAEVARIVGRTPAACRQLASSARRRTRAAQVAAPPARQARLVRDFKRAWEAGDIEALIGLLDPAATAITDGGGLVSAALEPVQGGERVARACAEFSARAAGLTVLERTVNGQPGLVARRDGRTVAVVAFEVAGDQITRIWTVLNPEKLRPWTSGELRLAGQRVDPAFQTPSLPGHQVGIAERVREQRDALVGRDQRHRQIARVGAAQGAELPFGPADQGAEHLGGGAIQAVGPLVELAGQGPERAAVLGGQLALVHQGADEPLQPGPRRAAPVQAGEHGPQLAGVRVDRRLDQLILGLEVVVHVPDRNAGGQRDVGERGPLDPLLPEHLAGRGHQPFALARGRFPKL